MLINRDQILSLHRWLEAYSEWGQHTTSITSHSPGFFERGFIQKVFFALYCSRRYKWIILYFDQRFSFLISLLLKLTRAKTKIALIETYPSITTGDNRKSLTEKFIINMYAKLYKYSSLVVVHSIYQADLYSEVMKVDRKVFEAVPYFCYEHDRQSFWSEEKRLTGPVVCSGRNRDLATFVKAAYAVPRKCLIVSNREAVDALPAGFPIPDNLEILCDVSKERYYTIMHTAALIVLPFAKDGFVRSFGHMAYLEAAMSKTPVVSSNSRHLEGYAINGEHVMQFNAGDHDHLAECINTVLQNCELYKELSQQSYEYVSHNFTAERYIHRILASISERTDT